MAASASILYFSAEHEKTQDQVLKESMKKAIVDEFEIEMDQKGSPDLQEKGQISGKAMAPKIIKIMVGKELYNKALKLAQAKNPNYSQVFELLEKSSKLGNAEAFYALATWY